MDPRLQDAPWHYVDGKHYGVPYQWGPNVLLYNTEAFKHAPTSWSVVFEEQKLADGKSNKGRVQAYDGPIYIADAALYLNGEEGPELGIKDPYELNETQYAAVLKLLRGQHPLIHQRYRYRMPTPCRCQDFERRQSPSPSPFQANTLPRQQGPGGDHGSSRRLNECRYHVGPVPGIRTAPTSGCEGRLAQVEDVAALFGSNLVVPKVARATRC